MKLQKHSPRTWYPKRINSRQRRTAARLAVRELAVIQGVGTPLEAWRALDRALLWKAKINMNLWAFRTRSRGANRATRRAFSKFHNSLRRYVAFNGMTMSVLHHEAPAESSRPFITQSGGAPLRA